MTIFSFHHPPQRAAFGEPPRCWARPPARSLTRTEPGRVSASPRTRRTQVPSRCPWRQVTTCTGLRPRPSDHRLLVFPLSSSTHSSWGGTGLLMT